MAKRRDENKDLRNFCLALGVLLGGFAALGWYNQRAFWLYLAGGAALVVALGLFAKPAVRPVFRGWMWLAQKLNWFTTRLLLTVIWLVIFLPVGLVLRLLRVDFFDRRWEPGKASYWRERPATPYDRRRTERLG
ncbi:MAG: hypothetical protein GX444_17855 [Myxococcales bacterium]|nr:hypothetical protein [Myxococcales bacterium]